MADTGSSEVSSIRRGHSALIDARLAVREFHQAVSQPDMSLVIFFCSSEYDLGLISTEMNSLFIGITVVGCTTAGEIGSLGYIGHSLTGLSFSQKDFFSVVGCSDQLKQFSIEKGQEFADKMLNKLEGNDPLGSKKNSFGLLLIDGMSVMEESVARTCQSMLRAIPLIGGSAGAGVSFDKPYIYFEGKFQTDRAVLILLKTQLPVKPFNTHHFLPLDKKMVVTEAEPAFRIVHELNGLPAAEEYARMLGVPPQAVSPKHFAASPVVVLIDGISYVRGIQKANADGSLTFYCAIEEGVVLRLAKGFDLLADLERTFKKINTDIGPPQAVIGFDCILRRLEVNQSPDKNYLVELLQKNQVTGFSTYGEQYCGIHLNQTFAGVAIGFQPSDKGES